MTQYVCYNAKEHGGQNKAFWPGQTKPVYDAAKVAATGKVKQVCPECGFELVEEA